MFFRVTHLKLDSQMVCSSLGKTICPTLSITELLMDFCLVLRPCGLSPFNVSMSTSVLLVQAAILLKFILSHFYKTKSYIKFPLPLALTVFLPPSTAMIPES